MAFTGYVQVYTGNGKGKTTAALGLALRAAGWQMKTYLAQFMKKGEYGELLAARQYLAGWLTIEQFGLPDFHRPQRGVSQKERNAAAAGLLAVNQAIQSGKYRIVILDEINTLLHFGILAPAAVVQIIASKPRTLELVLTGRHAPAAILAKADLITEMREIRHYFSRGVTARLGIEK
jgi:cob(I)alamin adenosyltransferase